MNRMRHRGVMMVVAIVLMGLIGMATAALMQRISFDFNRFRMERESAQVRQILIAATHTLRQNPASHIQLPAALIARDASVDTRSISRSGERIILRIDASYGKTRMSEFLTLTRHPAGWEVADAKLQ